ncbi:MULTISPECIES: hypothetical protein [unclassified Bradyrhizobium]|uniref:hypothetical protein n=1 Tax=unclassified Bradyrhizobium TaxID=2631580 RepID=UPI0023059D0B|nr:MULTISPECIES: hypothetical protein [unclassified Bradyrhizobium]
MSEDAANGRRPVMRGDGGSEGRSSPSTSSEHLSRCASARYSTYATSDIHDQAIQARMALIVGARTFDRLFAGVRFDKVDGDIPFVYAKDEDTAAKIEDEFALHISIIASKMLEREINIVMVFPRQLVS